MSIFSSLDNLHDEDEPVLESGTNIAFSIIKYDLETMVKNINDGTFSNIKIQSLIKFNIRDILDYSNFEKADTRKYIQELWISKRFLNSFITLFNSDPDFNDTVITSYRKELNKLIFDYVFTNNNKEPEIESLYIMIAKYINAKDIIPLTSVLPRDFSWQICVCRYSSFNVDQCVHNLNFAIVYSDIDISLNNIIYIYSRFYADDFSTLFCSSMIDCFDPNTDMAKRLYNRITLALLSILNSMTSSDIELVLRRYSNYLSLSQINTIRYQIRGLSEDYSRINKVVDFLESKDVYVP